MVGTASDVTNMMLPKSLSKLQQVTLEKFDSTSIYKILEDAKTHLTSILESKEGCVTISFYDRSLKYLLYIIIA